MAAAKRIKSGDWALEELMRRPPGVLDGVSNPASSAMKELLQINTVRGFFLQSLKDFHELLDVKYISSNVIRRARLHIALVATGSDHFDVQSKWLKAQHDAYERGEDVPTKSAESKPPPPAKTSPQPPPLESEDGSAFTAQLERAKRHQETMVDELAKLKRREARLQTQHKDALKAEQEVETRRRHLTTEHEQAAATLNALVVERDQLKVSLGLLEDETIQATQALDDAPTTETDLTLPGYTLYLDCAPTGASTSLTTVLRQGMSRALQDGGVIAALDRLRGDREEAYAQLALDLVRHSAIEPGSRITVDTSRPHIALAVEVLAASASLVVEAH